jgi:myo-inositol-1(or 4)-monophosphatase
MTTEDTLHIAMLSKIEALAVELAMLGGQEILAALGNLIAVQYKGDEEALALLRDPVSEVDGRVESLIRDRLADHFTAHGIIGEEMAVQPGQEQDFVWAVDPIDGTTNFINGFPLFASSVGVMYRGVPIVGALWCSTSHLLKPGVYHAGAEGGLRFDGSLISRPDNVAVRRRLAGDPQGQSGRGPWDARKTGSAAIECAFVAAGLLQVARFEAPNIWDVAGGIALARASGAMIYEQAQDGWEQFGGFGATVPQMAAWKRPLILGRPHDADLMARTLSGVAD